MTRKAEGEELEVVMQERKFLHDISNQLVVAQGMGAFVEKSLSEAAELDPKIIERMGKALKAVDNIISMVKERRAVLHGLSED